MDKVKEIISILEKYEKIHEILNENTNPVFKKIINIFQKYEDITLEEFEKLLSSSQLNQCDKPKKRTKSSASKNEGDDLELARLFYQYQNNEKISSDKLDQLNRYLADSKQTNVRKILEVNADERYPILYNMDIKQLTGKQLTFLGLALADVKITGNTKEKQKNNLLQVLYKMNQNLQMKQIYTTKEIR